MPVKRSTLPRSRELVIECLSTLPPLVASVGIGLEIDASEWLLSVFNKASTMCVSVAPPRTIRVLGISACKGLGLSTKSL